MSQLRRTITALAEEFAAAVVKALHAAPLSDLTAFGPDARPARGRPRSAGVSQIGNGRTPPRRRRGRPAGSTANVAQTVDAIVAALRSKPSGMRFEHIEAAVRQPKAELTKALRSALDADTIKKRGQRRGTTYFAA